MRWVAHAHRVSGVALAVFLPAHFFVLSHAIGGEMRLDGFLKWTEQPLVKAAEWALVLALAVHLGCGVRVLALEFLPWRDWQRTLAAAAAAFAVAAGLVFALAL